MSKYLQKIKGTYNKIIRNLKFVPPPTYRENKISVILPVFNESTWVRTGLESIKNSVDEILVGDNGSTDGTVEIIRGFMDEHPDLDIKFYDTSKFTFIEQQNFLLHKTRYRWIMRWMGDWVGHTTGVSSIKNIRRYLLSLKQTRYFAFLLNFPHLFLDPFHVHKDVPFNTEVWIYTYSPEVHQCYSTIPSPFEILWLPIFYQIIELKKYYVFHCTIKSKEHFLRRFYWGRWEKYGRTLYPTIRDMIFANIKKDFNTDDFSNACNLNMKVYFPYCKKYPRDLFGEYPNLLKPFLKTPPYRLIYDDNGNIIKRSDF
ncbi:MAG: glycosyltransferase family 2 protein [Candidatus Helarchaeota archaeon]